MDLSKPPRERPRTKTPRQVRRLSPSRVGQLVERYQGGTKVCELAIEFGIDRRTVSTHLRNNNVPPRTHTLPPQIVDQMVLLYEADLSLAAVAANTGTTTFAVQRELHKRGIAIRPKTRRKKAVY